MASGVSGIIKAAGYEGRPKVTSLRDVSAAEFIKAYSAHLKKGGRLTLPDWVDYVKTAPGRELPPLDPDWYYVRAASLARKIYLNHGLGVGALANWYGKTTAKRNTPQKHHKASRKVIRHILNQVRQQARGIRGAMRGAALAAARRAISARRVHAAAASSVREHTTLRARVLCALALARSSTTRPALPSPHFAHAQLEELGIVEKKEDGGRMLTPEGRKDLDTISNSAELEL